MVPHSPLATRIRPVRPTPDRQGADTAGEREADTTRTEPHSTGFSPCSKSANASREVHWHGHGRRRTPPRRVTETLSGAPGVQGGPHQPVDRGPRCPRAPSTTGSGGPAPTRVRPSEHSRKRSPARTSSRRRSSSGWARRRSPASRQLDSSAERGPLRRAVVARQLLQPSRSPPVRAAVARPDHRSTACRAPAAPRRCCALRLDASDRAAERCRCSFTCCRRSQAASIVSSKLDRGREVRERIADHPARDLSVPVSAEPVGHGPEPDLRPFDERVLVDARAPGRRRWRAAERKRHGTGASTSVSSGGPRACRPGTESTATGAGPTIRPAGPRTALGGGRPFVIRQLGSTSEEPSVHHNPSG